MLLPAIEATVRERHIAGNPTKQCVLAWAAVWGARRDVSAQFVSPEGIV
jgi:hypothetical protein